MLLVRKSMRFIFTFLLLNISILCDAACSNCKIDFNDMKRAPNPRRSNGYYVVGSVEKVLDDDTSVKYSMLHRPETKIHNGNPYQENNDGALVVSGGYGAVSSSNKPSIPYEDRNTLWSRYQHPQYLGKQQLSERYHPSTFVNTYEHAGEVLLSPSASETISVVEGLHPPSNSHQNQHSTSFTHDDVHVEQTSDVYNYNSYHQDDFKGPYPYSGYQQDLPSITEPPQEERQQSTLFGYYYIGRKLWYIPLYFSIYFVLYVAALIIKSLARHKIAFPQNLSDSVNAGRRHDRQLQAQLLLESATDKFRTKANDF